jgi:prophage regulatory protein
MSAKKSVQAAPGAFDQPVPAARANKTCGVVGLDDAPARADRFLRQREVLPLSGFGSSSTLKNKVKAGEFPAPIKISEGRQAWSEREVIAWQQEKIAKRNATLSSATEEGAPDAGRSAGVLAAPARP